MVAEVKARARLPRTICRDAALLPGSKALLAQRAARKQGLSRQTAHAPQHQGTPVQAALHPCAHSQARRAGPGPKLIGGAYMWPQQADCWWAGGMTAVLCMHSRLPGMPELAVPNSRADRNTGDGRSGMPRRGRSEHRASACRCMCRTRLRRRSGRLAAGRRMRAVNCRAAQVGGPKARATSGAPTRWPRSFPALLQLQAEAYVRASGHPHVRMHLMRSACWSRRRPHSKCATQPATSGASLPVRRRAPTPARLRPPPRPRQHCAPPRPARRAAARPQAPGHAPDGLPSRPRQARGRTRQPLAPACAPRRAPPPPRRARRSWRAWRAGAARWTAWTPCPPSPARSPAPPASACAPRPAPRDRAPARRCRRSALCQGPLLPRKRPAHARKAAQQERKADRVRYARQCGLTS